MAPRTAGVERLRATLWSGKKSFAEQNKQALSIFYFYASGINFHSFLKKC
jgi:hypothetical protein